MIDEKMWKSMKRDIHRNRYDEFEEELKDLLSWFQKACHEDNNRLAAVTNARQSILNHCRQYDKRLRQEHGIL